MKYRTSNLSIQPASNDDVPALVSIGNRCRLAPWTASGFMNELKRPDAVILVCRNHSRIIAFLASRINTASEVHREADLYNIAVEEEFRRQRIGSMLLQVLIETCRNENVSKLWLDVRITNLRAIEFYRWHGFNAISNRKHFYSDPTEDSLTMVLELTPRQK